MPCYTEPHSYCHHESTERERSLCNAVSALEKIDKENKRILENQKDQLDYYKKKSDEATDMLCRLCASIDWDESNFPPDVQEWWTKHKEWDKKRNES